MKFRAAISRSARRRAPVLLEAFEPRVLLSAAAAVDLQINPTPPLADFVSGATYAVGAAGAIPADEGGPGFGTSVETFRAAYGVDEVMFGGVAGDGTGQTIAVIEAYDNPNIWTELQTFDASFGIPDPPSFTRIAQDGSSNYPATANASWWLESSLDVEWAHAMAPGANILLVEATDSYSNNLIASAVARARSYAGVSVISMSWGYGESSVNEAALDSILTTPSGHNGITFVAATGDHGAPGNYPAFSPNVVAVGGTNLAVNSDGSYASETGFSGGGGISTGEAQPQYQSASGVVTQSATYRTSPDVSLAATTADGIPVFSNGGWVGVGGTSFAAPAWAAIFAIANQGRALAGLGTLYGTGDALARLYAMPEDYFNDITSGSNGFSAGTGYDLVTGLGSPKANLIIPALVGNPVAGFDMSVDPGWSLEGTAPFAWQYGVPAGQGSNGKDPASGHTGSDVIGFNLAGNYANSMTSTLYATTPVIDATNFGDLKLTFWRWLGVQSADQASIQVWDGSVWTTLYSNPTTSNVSDSSWVFQEFALPASTYDNPEVQIRWGMGPTNGSTNYPGWNIDDVSILGTELPTISGQVFLDANGNGVLDAGEMGVNNVTVYIDYNNNGIEDADEPTASTAGNGNFTFDQLTPGAFVVAVAVAGGDIQTNAGAAVATDNGLPGTDNLGLFPTLFSTAGSYALAFDSNRNQAVISGVAGTFSIAPGLLDTLTFAPSGGGDTLTVDFANGDPVPAGGVFLTGGSGNSLVVEGGGGAWSVSPAQIGNATDAIHFANVTAMTLGAGQFAIQGALVLNALTIDPNAVVTLAAGGGTPLTVGALLIDPTSVLDVNDDGLIVNAADPAAMLGTLAGYLSTGRDGGDWDGLGIRSSAAHQAYLDYGNSEYMGLALARNDLLPQPLAALDGAFVGGTAAVVKYTYAGDANLDGMLTVDDYLAIDTGYLLEGRGYGAGDFDYSGTIDAADFGIIGQNFGRQGAPLTGGEAMPPEAIGVPNVP